MRQTTTLLLATTLAFLCLQICSAWSLSKSNALRNSLMSASATSSGIINLKKDAYSEGSFYVEADLSSYYQSGSNKSSSALNSTGAVDTVKFLVSIPNTETMVATSCLGFNYYNCQRYSCTYYSWTKAIDFPSFTANVQYARSYVYLDYNYWGLNSASLYIAQSCIGGAATGSNRYGVIGLGTDAFSLSDFTSEAIFSVLIDSDLNTGKLLFMKDSKYCQSSSPLHSLSANGTWQIRANSGYIQVGTTAAYFYTNVMFDINSDAIGLPEGIYSAVTNYVNSLDGVYCYSGYTYRPYCYTSKQLKDLPDIILGINSDQIKIPSQIYATLSTNSGGYTYFYLNFKAINSTLSGKNHVSPSFANSIILDANFMSYYYTVFDATSGYNTIYLYPSINAPDQSNLVKFIVAGTLGALLIASLCCCCCKKKKITTNRTTATAPLNNTTFNNAIQAPVVYNQGVVDNSAPYYSYDATNYNQNGYNYPAQPQVYQPYVPPQGGMYIPPPTEGN